MQQKIEMKFRGDAQEDDTFTVTITVTGLTNDQSALLGKHMSDPLRDLITALLLTDPANYTAEPTH